MRGSRENVLSLLSLCTLVRPFLNANNCSFDHLKHPHMYHFCFLHSVRIFHLSSPSCYSGVFTVFQISQDTVLSDSRVLTILGRRYRLSMKVEKICTGLHDINCGVFVTARVENMYTTAHHAGYEKMSL